MTIKDLPAAARPRERLLALGPQALADAELLALLLRTGVRGQGVLQLAEQLLERFGGLGGLLRTSSAELAGVKGLGPAKRSELAAVLEIARRTLARQLREAPVFDQPGRLAEFLVMHFGALGHEVFVVVFLDAQLRLLRVEEMFRGTLTSTAVHPREVARRALELGAAGVVVAHNHPAGQPEPSRADIALTETLKSALALLDVRLLDHLIVADGRAVSLAQRGLV